jgi:hypothetical protein
VSRSSSLTLLLRLTVQVDSDALRSGTSLSSPPSQLGTSPEDFPELAVGDRREEKRVRRTALPDS